MELKNGSDEVRRHFGELLPSTGGAVGGALAGVLMGGPAGAVVGAAAGAILDHVTREALRRRWDRGAQTLQVAAAEAHLTPDQLLERILADERLLELAAAVIAAAAETTLNAKLQALGQALGRGTLGTDDAEVDTERFIVDTLAALEAPHIRVLGQIAQRYESYGEERAEDGAPRAHGWTLDALSDHLPGLALVFRSVLGTLSSNGLILDTAVGTWDYNARWAITEYGEQVLRLLEEGEAESS